MAKNITEFTIEFGETDMAGIVFYPNYFRWFDRATHALLRSIGLPFEDLLYKHGFADPLIEVGCRFFAPLRYNDFIRLETKVVELRTRSFKLEHLLYKGEALVGKGYEVRSWCKWDETSSEGELKPVPIPLAIAAKLRD